MVSIKLTAAFNLLRFTLCWMIGIIIAATAFSQQKEQSTTKATPNPEPYKSRGRDSEVNGAILDDLYHEANASDGTVFIISRLGKGERDQRLHERRLHNVIERFTYSGRRFSRAQIVVTIGERVSGKGRAEVYINGRLRFISEIDRGKAIMVYCCEAFPVYYPWYRGKRRILF